MLRPSWGSGQPCVLGSCLPLELGFACHEADSGCQLCPSLCVTLAWGAGVQASPQPRVVGGGGAAVPRPRDPAGSPEGWDLPGDIPAYHPTNMSLLSTLTSVPPSHVPWGAGTIAPVFLLGRPRPGPGSVPLVPTPRGHCASVADSRLVLGSYLPPGVGDLASAPGRWGRICPVLAVNIYRPHHSPGLTRL